MAKGDITYSLGQTILHPENNGALQIVHHFVEGADGKPALQPDQHVEFKWDELEKALGPDDAAELKSLLGKVGEAARAKRPALKDAKPAPTK